MPFEVSHQWFVRLWTTSYELESSKIKCHKGFYFSKFKIHELYNCRFTTLAQFYFYLLDLDRLDVRWPPPLRFQHLYHSLRQIFCASCLLLVPSWPVLPCCFPTIHQYSLNQLGLQSSVPGLGEPIVLESVEQILLHERIYEDHKETSSNSSLARVCGGKKVSKKT